MDQNLINEIRSKVDIVDIISSYIPLIKKGKNFFGVCPFHDDSNPSMSVSKELQIYRCFSCGASGNVFTFLMEYEHISFREALEILANKAGISISSVNIKKPTMKYDKLYEIYNISNKFYQNNLNSKLGLDAREYLKRRSLNEDVIKSFGIGLALPEMDNLVKLLTTKGYDIKTLNDIGLASNEHDTYINRIMFPLMDITGKVVGFSGRIYDNSNLNKYLNTKETPIFKKGLMLYNYHNAKEEVRLKKSVIIMEGFMDVIRAFTIDVKNVVALMGTALTNEQASLIKRLSNDVILCFDGDEAGKKATLTNGKILEKLNLNVKVIALTNNDDPDTFILNNGKDRFNGLIENAINFSDYKIKALKQGVNLNSDLEKTNYINKVLQEASNIKDEVRCEIIVKNLAKEFDLSYNTLEKRLLEYKEKTKVNEKPVKEVSEKKRYNKYEKATFAFLYYMLVDEKLIDRYNNEGIFLPYELARVLASEISYFYEKYGIINIADFYTYLNDKKELLEYLNLVLSFDFKEDITDDVILDYLSVIKEYSVNQEIKRLKEMVEKEVDPLEKAKIADKIRLLKMESV